MTIEQTDVRILYFKKMRSKFCYYQLNYHAISKNYLNKQINHLKQTSRHIGINSMYYTLEHLNMIVEYYVLKLYFLKYT